VSEPDVDAYNIILRYDVGAASSAGGFAQSDQRSKIDRHPVIGRLNVGW
jgi:hypothetical protein